MTMPPGTTAFLQLHKPFKHCSTLLGAHVMMHAPCKAEHSKAALCHG